MAVSRRWPSKGDRPRPGDSGSTTPGIARIEYPREVFPTFVWNTGQLRLPGPPANRVGSRRLHLSFLSALQLAIAAGFANRGVGGRDQSSYGVARPSKRRAGDGVERQARVGGLLLRRKSIDP